MKPEYRDTRKSTHLPLHMTQDNEDECPEPDEDNHANHQNKSQNHNHVRSQNSLPRGSARELPFNVVIPPSEGEETPDVNVPEGDHDSYPLEVRTTILEDKPVGEILEMKTGTPVSATPRPLNDNSAKRKSNNKDGRRSKTDEDWMSPEWKSNLLNYERERVKEKLLEIMKPKAKADVNAVKASVGNGDEPIYAKIAFPANRKEKETKGDDPKEKKDLIVLDSDPKSTKGPSVLADDPGVPLTTASSFDRRSSASTIKDMSKAEGYAAPPNSSDEGLITLAHANSSPKDSIVGKETETPAYIESIETAEALLKKGYTKTDDNKASLSAVPDSSKLNSTDAAKKLQEEVERILSFNGEEDIDFKLSTVLDMISASSLDEIEEVDEKPGLVDDYSEDETVIDEDDTSSLTAESGYVCSNDNVVDVAAALCSIDGIRRINGPRPPCVPRESTYLSHNVNLGNTPDTLAPVEGVHVTKRLYSGEEPVPVQRDDQSQYTGILLKTMEKLLKEKPWMAKNNPDRVEALKKIMEIKARNNDKLVEELESPDDSDKTRYPRPEAYEKLKARNRIRRDRLVKANNMLYEDKLSQIQQIDKLKQELSELASKHNIEKENLSEEIERLKREMKRKTEEEKVGVKLGEPRLNTKIRWTRLFALIIFSFSLFYFATCFNEKELTPKHGVCFMFTTCYGNKMYSEYTEYSKNSQNKGVSSFMKDYLREAQRSSSDENNYLRKVVHNFKFLLNKSWYYLRLGSNPDSLTENTNAEAEAAKTKSVTFGNEVKTHVSPVTPDKHGLREGCLQVEASLKSVPCPKRETKSQSENRLDPGPLGTPTLKREEHVASKGKEPIGSQVKESTITSQHTSNMEGTFGLRDKNGKYIGPSYDGHSSFHALDPSGKLMQAGPLAMEETNPKTKVNVYLKGLFRYGAQSDSTEKVGARTFPKNKPVKVDMAYTPSDPSTFSDLTASVNALNSDTIIDCDEQSVVLLNAGQYGFTGPVLQPEFDQDAGTEAVAHLIGSRPFVNVTLNDSPRVYCALYDTGASISVISRDVLDELLSLGNEITRCPHKVEVKTYGGNILSHIGSVLLAVGFKSPSNKNFAIHIPFVVVNRRTDPPVILGGPQIMSHRINLDMMCQDKMALVLQDSGDIVSECILKNTVFHRVCCTDAVKVHPETYVEVLLKLPGYARNPLTNWQKRRVLVELDSPLLDDLVFMECTSLMEGSQVRAFLLSKVKESFVIPEGALKGKISLLDREDLEVREVNLNAMDVNPWGNAGTNLLRSCACDLSNILVLGNCHSVSGLGYDLEGRNLQEDFKTTPESRLKLVSSKRMDGTPRKMLFLIKGENDYADIIPSINDKLQKAGFNDRCEINLLYQAPTVLSNDVFQLVQELGTKYSINLVNMDVKPNWEIEDKCTICASLRLQYSLDYEVTTKFPCVRYVFCEPGRVPGDLLVKEVDSQELTIKVGSVSITGYAPNPNYFNFFFHLESYEELEKKFNARNADPEALGRALTNVIYLLNSMVKPLFPLARLDAKVDCSDPFASIITKSLKDAHELSRTLDSYLNHSRISQPRYKEARDGMETESLSLLKYRGSPDVHASPIGCKCHICNLLTWDGNASHAFRGKNVALGRWPSTPREDLKKGLLDSLDIMEIVAYPDPQQMQDDSEKWDTNCVFNGSDSGKSNATHEINLDVDTEGYGGGYERCQKTMPEDPMSFFPLPHLSDEQREKAHAVLLEFSDVVSYDKNDTTMIKNYTYRPVLKSYRPYFSKPYRLSEEADRAVSAIIAHMLKRGIIAPIRFPQMVFSAFVVRKNSPQKMEADVRKNKKVVVDHGDETEEQRDARLRTEYRLILDVRPFNSQLVQKLPNDQIVSIHDTMAKLKDGSIYCSCDIREFFLSLRVDSSSLPYLCFSHKGVTYTHLMAPPGVADLPAFTTQILTRAISPAIADRIARHIDDCAWSAVDFEDSLRVLKIFLKDMRDIGVLLSAQKMQLFTSEIEFLGFNIRNGKVYIPERRKEHIKSLPIPETRADMHKFLGTLGFVSHYIKDYSAYTSFLFPLLSDKVPYKLDEIQIEAIKTLKSFVEKVDGLYFFNPKFPLHVAVDASYIGGGAVFWQRPGNHDQLIQYSSFKFNQTEIRTMSSGTKEAMALSRVLKNNKILVQSGAEVIVHTDFRALVAVYAYCNVAHSTILQRWMSLASSMCPDLKLVWRKGDSPEISGADYMSRLGLGNYRTKFSLSREVSKRTIDALTEKVDVPDLWKIGNYKVTFPELERYAAKVANSPVAAKVLDQVAGIRDEQVTSFDDGFVEGLNEETADNGAMPGGQISALAFMAPHAMTFEEMIQAQLDDEECMERIENLAKGTKNKKFEMVGALLCKIKGDRRLIVLPHLCAIKMLCIMHLFAHSPADSLMKQFRFHYYTTNLKDKANLVCNVCKSCRIIKMPYKKRYPPGITQRARRYREILSIDHFKINQAQLSSDDRTTYTHVISFTDQFTRYSWVKLAQSTYATDTAQALTEFFSAFGPWEEVHSDGGPGMASNAEVYDVLRDMGIKVFVGIPDHPTGHYVENNNKLLRKAAMLIAAATNRNAVDCIYLGYLKGDELPIRVTQTGEGGLARAWAHFKSII